MRSDRLLAELKSAGEPDSSATRAIVEKLASLGPKIIPSILSAIPSIGVTETAACIQALTAVANDSALPTLLQALTDEAHPKTMAAVTTALSRAESIRSGLFLDALTNPDLDKKALIEIIAAHSSRLTVKELLNAAYPLESTSKAALFKVIDSRSNSSDIGELLGRLEGKDVNFRLHLLELLSRFGTPEVQHSLCEHLKSNSRLIRQAALKSLLKTPPLHNVELVAPLLADPDMDVTNRAIELMIRAQDPHTVERLLPALQHESEYARRAAVEVLNEVGTVDSIKLLLGAIKDGDWWVRSRAADALGKIGGPRVVDAVLELIGDPDENVRRTAVEILNLTKDERAIDFLLEATKDSDWWVSERAVDALSDLRTPAAISRFVEMLDGPPKSAPAAIRALGKCGDRKMVPVLLPLLLRPEDDIRLEAISALTELTDRGQADTVLAALRELIDGNSDDATSAAAGVALDAINTRVAGQDAMQLDATSPTRGQSRTALADDTDLGEMVRKHAATTKRLDIATLSAGQMIDSRYKYIQRIGKGAFGTVLLVEDSVVGEPMVLKFLNASVVEDQEAMQRFVHELRYSRKITHRNVIRIYDFLLIAGNYAISMEYFPSHTLHAELVGDQPLDVAKAIRYGIDIASGMSIAHAVGIVHRDLKPANVLLNQEGLLKIVDFGVAATQREGDAQLTKTGYVIGSPKYMSPEQILGKEVDPRADVYSLGVILYEMLTGTAPYTKGDHMAVMYQHVQGKAQAAIELNPALPPHLSELVMKAMAVDKSLRFQDMTELRLALEAFA